MKKLAKSFLVGLFLLLSVAVVQAAPSNSICNVYDYHSLGALTATAGDNIVFDTGTLSVTGTIGAVTLNKTGVEDTAIDIDSDGETVAFAVFAFHTVNIASGVTVRVQSTGSRRALVIAARNELTIGADIDMAGDTGSGGTGGPGCSGGEGGVSGTSLSSSPPGATAGNGGDQYQTGVGYGGGKGRANNGGGGGGAIALSCRAILTLTGTIDLSGGKGASTISGGGGGGSGGGLLLAAPTIILDDGSNAAVLDASGGDGGGGNGHDAHNGGGGGGGRIALFVNTYTPGSATLSVAYGLNGEPQNRHATAGTITQSNIVFPPPPPLGTVVTIR